jgi:hypothetical protein
LTKQRGRIIVPDDSPQNILDRTTSQTKPIVGESILYDIFMKYGKPTDEKMSKLKGMYELSIRTQANRKRRTSDLSYQDLLIECACDLFTEMVLAFNILLTGIIGPDEHLKFFFGQTGYIDKHMLELPTLIEKRLRAMTSSGVNEKKLAKAFIKLIQQAYSVDIPGNFRV